jgi:hypothetical protein
MKREFHPNVGRTARELVLRFASLALLLLMAGPTRADQVEMLNGDRYIGKVLSLDNDTLVLQNEVLGTVRLPRGKVALITFRANPAANPAQAATTSTNRLAHLPALASTNANADVTAALRQLGANTNLIRQVQSQFLAGAGPEANAKFNELLSGLMTGKLSVNDIRREAKTAADQIRAARKDLGEEAGSAIDGYLAIIDSFLKETETMEGDATKQPALSPKSRNGETD